MNARSCTRTPACIMPTCVFKSLSKMEIKCRRQIRKLAAAVPSASTSLSLFFFRKYKVLLKSGYCELLRDQCE